MLCKRSYVVPRASKRQLVLPATTFQDACLHNYTGAGDNQREAVDARPLLLLAPASTHHFAPIDVEAGS